MTKLLRFSILTALLLAFTVLLPFLAPPPPSVEAAAPAFPGGGSAVMPLTFHLSGQFTASKTGIVKFSAMDMRVLYVTASIQAKGGTQGTTTLTVNNGASAVTNAMDLSGTAGTIVEATLVTAQRNVAKNTAITADLVITGGSSPTIDHITLVIWVQRR